MEKLRIFSCRFFISSMFMDTFLISFSQLFYYTNETPIDKVFFLTVI